MRSSWLIAIVLTFVSAQAQSLRVTPVTVHSTDQFPKSIQFYCAQGYKQQACREDVLKLRHELGRYPIELLGPWSFILVSSDNWKDLVRGLGGAPESPGFSILENRTTVFEQALFSAYAFRSVELLKMYGVVGDALLQLAITHELGHVVCSDTDERRADDYGRELRAGRVPVCPAQGQARNRLPAF